MNREPLDVSTLTLTTYQRRHRSAIRELCSRSPYSLIHLDWHEIEPWLDGENPPIRLAWSRGRLIGVLAAAPPLSGTTWIRLVAVAPESDPAIVLGALWQQLRAELRALGVKQTALLIVRDWIAPLAASFGFTPFEQIITLRRADLRPVSIDFPRDLTIRPTYPNDLPDLVRADQAAFAPPWQMSLADLRQAERISAHCTAALLDNRIVGYALCILYSDGAHLARLAVTPNSQGHGVGTALVAEALQHFGWRGVHTMTVNTQLTNTVSQHIYTRLGFQRNGYDLPVWVVDI